MKKIKLINPVMTICKKTFLQLFSRSKVCYRFDLTLLFFNIVENSWHYNLSPRTCTAMHKIMGLLKQLKRFLSNQFYLDKTPGSFYVNFREIVNVTLN